MAYPIGHSLVGLAIGKKTHISPLFAIILAMLPDIDYFFGLVAKGNLLALHEIPFIHSLQFVLLTTICAFVWLWIKKLPFIKERTIGVFLLVFSHWFIDTHVFILPYQIAPHGGTNGLWDFLITFILKSDFLINNLLDLVFYGALYLCITKIVFLLPPLKK